MVGRSNNALHAQRGTMARAIFKPCFPRHWGAGDGGRATAPSPSVLPRPPFYLRPTPGYTSREKKRTLGHGIAVRPVGTRASTSIQEMRVVWRDGDKDVDADTWRGERMVYGEAAAVGERVLPLVEWGTFGLESKIVQQWGGGVRAVL